MIQLNHSIMNTEEAGFVKIKYDSIYANLEAYEANVFTMWSANIIDESEANLHKPLLVRENELLKVNFDPKVVALLREVKYLGALSVAPPQTAADIYSKSETFRAYIFSLEHITGQYNNIRTTVLDVERPLIESKINEIDGQISQALGSLTWSSAEVDSYITSIGESVGTLSNTLQVMKNNVAQVQKLLKGWSASPLIERKDPKKCLGMDEKESKVASTFEQIKKDGLAIHELLQQTKELVSAVGDSANWVNYRNYVDDIVSKGYKCAIQTSLEYLSTNMEQVKGAEANPLLEAKLELENETLLFTPNMDEDSPDGFLAVIEDFVSDIYNMASLMPRISSTASDNVAAPATDAVTEAPQETQASDVASETHGSTENKITALPAVRDDTYLPEMVSNEALGGIKRLILERVRTIIEKCLTYKDGFDQYTYLWTVCIFYMTVRAMN